MQEVRRLHPARISAFEECRVKSTDARVREIGRLAVKNLTLAPEKSPKIGEKVRAERTRAYGISLP